jgi:LmbE family N-acetylglucosaminyl deacetylase
VAVFPHPDDESLGLGGTLAKYSSEGVETYLVCATHGERGWFDSLGPDPGFEGVGRVREAELHCAAQHLGLGEVNFLGYLDGDVDQAEPREIIGKITLQIRRIRPQLVVTFSPDAAYGHPDHIALSQFTNAANVCAADSYFNPKDGPSHRVSKFYYMADSMDLVKGPIEIFGGISMEIDGVIRQHKSWQDREITPRFSTAEHMDKVLAAVRCHRSQLPGYGRLGEMAADQVGWFFGEGTFYRAFSLVNGGRNVETDLFDGLR